MTTEVATTEVDRTKGLFIAGFSLALLFLIAYLKGRAE